MSGDQELMAYLQECYPLGVRVLPDGSIAALFDLIYTRSILLGIDRHGWSKRFCFAERGLAYRRFQELQSEDDVPEGYIDSRD